jgi:hypothetical protein
MLPLGDSDIGDDQLVELVALGQVMAVLVR